MMIFGCTVSLKTFKSAFMLLLIQTEQHKQSFQHTSLFLCYRHLNNRSTGIKVYLGINTYCDQMKVSYHLYCNTYHLPPGGGDNLFITVYVIESFIQEILILKQVFMKRDTDSFIKFFYYYYFVQMNIYRFLKDLSNVVRTTSKLCYFVRESWSPIYLLHGLQTDMSDYYNSDLILIQHNTNIHYIDKSIGSPSLEQKNALPNLWQQRWEHNSCI